MQVRKLHRLLGELIDGGHGHKEVTINKDTFKNPLESDGAVIMPIESIYLQWYDILDGDGFSEVDSRGYEKRKLSLILDGENKHAPKAKQLN